MAEKNEKILDLSTITDEQFDNVSKFISDYIKRGESTPINWQTPDMIREYNERVVAAFASEYNRGVKDACIGAVIAIVACTGIIGSVEYFKRKKKIRISKKLKSSSTGGPVETWALLFFYLFAWSTFSIMT